MTIPGASRYNLICDPWPEIFPPNGPSMTPNSQGAVTLVCDDGVRRCKTVRQWALLCERSEGEEK